VGVTPGLRDCLASFALEKGFFHSTFIWSTLVPSKLPLFTKNWKLPKI
jgi:hypothetical protein